MKLRERVAIITGAGSGIGEATAELFAAEGASVTVVTLSDSGQKTADTIEAQGGDALFVRCDIGDSEQVQHMVQRTIDRFGCLDILVNNAARNRETPVVETVAEMPEEEWYATINTNLSGYFLCSRYALQQMLPAGRGNIVNVSSAAGLHGVEKLSAYAASKAGVISLTKSMALDYGPQGIRVNAILPTIDTARFRRAMTVLGRGSEEDLRAMDATVPMRRRGLPAEAAAAILFFASDDSSYTSGAILPVDGGAAARH